MSMVLVVIDKLSNLKQFVMWASVEYAMQYNAQYEVFVRDRKHALDNLPPVLDLSRLSELSSMEDGDVLYMVGHGNKESTHMWAGEFNGSQKRYEDLGKSIGAQVIGKKIVVHCGACFAAAKDTHSGLNKLAAALKRAGAGGVTVKGFKGATVTNLADGPTSVVDSREMTSASELQSSLMQQTGTQGQNAQQRLNSWKNAHPTASAHDIAQANMDMNWGFFQQFSFDPGTNKRRDFYLPFPSTSVPNTGAEEVSVTS